MEKDPINFLSSDSDLPYNQPISINEVLTAIHKNFKNSSPGIDKIHPAMLKNLHINAIKYITHLYNQIFQTSTFPQCWKTAIVIPILKAQSRPSNCGSYRPISLTSVLGKTFEKIINKRLIWYLESNNILSPHQYGFRKSKSTLHAIANLESEIKLAFNNNSSLFTVFFDLEKAYDRTWKYHICKTLHKYGLKNNLPLIIQNFLKNRYLTVRVSDQLSTFHQIQNGVPQGSVISVTLFLVAINDISSKINFPLTHILFADDLSINIQSRNPSRAHRLLQNTINKLDKWSLNHGFRFSALKSRLIIFQKKYRTIHFPPLVLNNQIIPHTRSTKFLGLIFDYRLSWIPHIKELKAKCQRSLNILKYVSHPATGCNRKILPSLYNALIQSRLDYGAPIYGMANRSALAILDSIQSSGLRLVTGAFRTSPRMSLCAETASLPLSYRRETRTAKFLTSLSQDPSTSNYTYYFDETSLNNFSTTPTKHAKLHFELSIGKKFKFQTLNPIFVSSPPWSLRLPSFRLDLSLFPKNQTNPLQYKQLLLEIINSYPNTTKCYTDGSKLNHTTVCSYSIENSVFSHRLRNSYSVFSAELAAIYFCLEAILQASESKPSRNFLIFSDSLSSLQAINDIYTTNPLIQRIHALFQTLLLNNYQLTLIWIPGHIGIPGNERVDSAARQATRLPRVNPLLPPASDLFTFIKSHILSHWNRTWLLQTSNKLHAVKPSPIYWKSSDRTSRREEMVLARLRIGHSRLTHTHLISHLFPPDCPKCSEENLTVDHLFSCPQTDHLRAKYSVPSNRSMALQDSADLVSRVLNFLREADLFSII